MNKALTISKAVLIGGAKAVLWAAGIATLTAFATEGIDGVKKITLDSLIKEV